MARSDVHRPSALDPADYVYVGEADLHDEHGFEEWDEFALQSLGVMRAEHGDAVEAVEAAGFVESTAMCDLCGKRGGIRYLVFYFHRPSSKIVTVGQYCAVQLGLADKAQLVTYKREQARLAEIKRDKALAAWLADDGSRWELAIELGAYEGEDSFLTDLRRSLRDYGCLTEKQEPWARKKLAGEDEYQERKAAREAAQKEADAAMPAPAPVVEGRIVVTGVVLGLKTQISEYGSTLKMLVCDDRGFKVWVTVPSGLEGIDQLGREGLKGHRIEFTATVTRSDRDPTFGIGKRPTKGRVLDVEIPGQQLTIA